MLGVKAILSGERNALLRSKEDIYLIEAEEIRITALAGVSRVSDSHFVPPLFPSLF